ncbi:hypothetical protein [Micromonospora sp. NPDC023956]|uniref:phenylacetate--CoA ligase family protein n=1 Tax=Micromonospora sp. NPDC023956 TaxID=3155722 RepID=UPI0033F26E4F
MIWHHEERIDVLAQARREMCGSGGRIPDAQFYERKLAEVWRRAGDTPAYAGIGGYTPAAFAALPVTAREELKARPADFLAVAPNAALRYYETTGSTGTPTPTPRLAEDVIWNTVSVAEAWRELLDGPDERVLNLLPSDVVPVGDLVAQACDYLGVAHTRAYPFTTGILDWDRLADLWCRVAPTTVFVAPGVALQWTRLAKQRRLLDTLNGSVQRLMLLGEVNTPALRARLGRWWGATALDGSYGSTETGTLATACTAGNQHLLPTAAYFELLTGQGLVPAGAGAGAGTAAGTGELVVTPLNAYARPLLRLNTGDVVTLTTGCPCGRRTPLVRVHGRASDTTQVRGVALAPGQVEEIVYAATTATGYLIEVDADGTWARLLLERDVDGYRSGEPAMVQALQTVFDRSLGLAWDQVAFVNTLPVNTKSGAAQKSWKRSNVRVLESA